MQVNDLASSSSSRKCYLLLHETSFFSSRLVLHTQLVKNVIVFRFDQSDEQPIDDDDDDEAFRCTYTSSIDRQLSRKGEKMTFC